MEWKEILEKADKNNVKDYAKALLDSEKMCWDCDPILIEEFWINKVREFLKTIAE